MTALARAAAVLWMVAAAACSHASKSGGAGRALASGNPASDGADRHDFLYCGEWQTDREGETMYLVRGGKIVWSHTISDKEEYGDCTLMSTGHVLFVRKNGASEIVPDLKGGQGGRITWDYQAPKGTEVHTVQPIGTGKVLIMQNGTPPRLMIISKADNKVEKSCELEAKPSVHGQFRHVRMLANGNFLVAHLNLGEVREYAADCKTVLWKVAAPSAWAAVRLQNGNTLISGNQHGWLREVNARGETVWELNQKDVDFELFTIQGAERLANGNTIVNNWVSTHDKPRDQWPSTVQTFEVTPDKKVVWKLQAWKEPLNLGPASMTQVLDNPGTPENPGELMR